MSSRATRITPFLMLILAGLAPSPSLAQRVVPDDEWCREDSRTDGQERYCEVREYSLAPRALVKVDAAPNGSIRVEGWDRNEITLRARVSAWSGTGEPQAIVQDIDIGTGETVSAVGPEAGRRAGWSVSYRLMVPRSSGLDLQSTNGGIHISGISGTIDFNTMNGGVTLADVGGKVRGETTNGGVSVELSGARWQGEGLDVRTTNGGVTLSIPEGYQATLETGTVNGSLDTDVPVTVRGRLRSSRITTDLNGGGPTIRAVTTNGPVRIRMR